ncbi:MAG: hydrogenase nickel incorporation protein HypB [Pseudanabaena sp. M57BS1SP1A06MG]|nr:hydrogenase nickel incorporation protein HypB [Pseudanabaena sp. M53BS1SP1A06MG]MCA6582776.1 hydrogenase nickel incorporation protein HypB [Pseudanabaena sp. M34BS1SP1A06MG]MCA6593889.1 hydrogenase nickel incorporation protein HypB [Pseudanabaena sp. M38BS1SP1A06MG]MCA6598704.1 hydrogenase nickel incorporation protein HypB [Pseudanabaena sp. M57BS1SP1A06MG]
MCQDCGCSNIPEGMVKIYAHDHSHDHDHPHTHDHAHDHEHHHHHEHNTVDSDRRTISVSQSILSQNDRLAERNRGYFMAKGISVLNVLSSPGAGKTALLERTMTELHDRLKSAIIVGDLATDNDAQRLRRSGAEVIQITTGSVCHLEAEMIAKALQQMLLDGVQLLAIENVGNLVCPAAYDLGENLRVVVFSVTEGEDKPLKYPVMFKTADIVLISKIDLAEVVEFNRELALHNIHQIAPQAKILEVSAKTGLGMQDWCQFIEQSLQKSLTV